MTTPRRSARRRPVSSGNAALGVTRDPEHDDRMRPCLQFIDDQGLGWVIELSASEVANLRADADTLLTADAETVAGWWRKLADGSDGRPWATR